MKNYEIFLEENNPCGGDDNLRKSEMIEASAESPEAYVKEHATMPVLDTSVTTKGEVVIETGDGSGHFVKYTFTEV